MIETTERQYEDRYKNRWYGKYRAFVRDHHDPERLGRVRMEIPAVLGTGRENWSEWAYPCFPYGGNDDGGCFLVPEEGASVWAEFEGGIVQHPIWTGVWLAGSAPGEQAEESKRECSGTCLDCGDRLEHQTYSPDDREHRKYHAHPPYACPRFRILMKTETGHTILCDDKDEAECLKVLDRSGQGLHFECRVKRTAQAGNTLRRGTREAESGNQIDLRSQIAGQRAKIELTDLSGQFVRLEAWQDREKIHIQSCDRERTRWQKILLDTTKGREKVHIWGLNGTQEILLDSTAGVEKIELRDKAGQTVLMNAAAGAESLRVTDKSGSTILMDAVGGNILVKAANMTFLNP